jgi:hypothetical protein
MMSSNFCSLSLVCWNVRGLGDSRKYDIIKETILNNSFDIVLDDATNVCPSQGPRSCDGPQG